MTLDPATLAAVRERIVAERYTLGLGDNARYNEAIDCCLSIVDTMARDVLAEMPPPLSAAEVRRFAREEVDRAAIRPEPNAPTMTPGSTQTNTWPMAGDMMPPAPPQPAKRVEAWSYEPPGDPRVVVLRKPAYVRADIALTYLTHFPGVTDAASAEAFERAVRALVYLTAGDMSPKAASIQYARAALAPFLPKEST